MKSQSETIAGIDCLTVKGQHAHTAVIFFHGYGANMHDLFPLWQMWHQEKFSWYFPNGVLPLPMGYYEGRAWFSIDIERLEQAIREGTHREMADAVPPEFDETLTRMSLFIKEVARTHSHVVIGGFSQGAMCASHLALKSDLNIDGLILLSGNMVASPRWPTNAKGMPFYQAHGSQDPILSLTGAKLLEEKLLACNFQGKLHVFSGGHEIPMSVINEVKAFLLQFNEPKRN